MKRNEAISAIKAILAAIDDKELPKPSRIEQEDGKTLVWFGGHGRYLGSAKRNGEREPLIYRDKAVQEALEMEATYRLDAAHQNEHPA